MNGPEDSGFVRQPRVFYGWYVLAASFVILFVNAGGQTIIGVMVKPIAAEFAWSRGAISLAVFLNLAVYAASTLVTGRLYDRWGPKWVIAGFALLVALGYTLMATTDALWQFLLYYGILVAAGFGGTSVPLFGSIMGNWFEKRRGLAVSLAIAGYPVGQFVLIPILSETIVISGWRIASLWIAGLTLVVTLALTFGVVRGDPDRFGLRPYGSDIGSLVRAGISSRDRPIVPQAAMAVPRDLALTEAMRTRSLWLITMVWFVCGGGDYVVLTHLVPMVTDFGISNAVGASMLAWCGLLGLAGLLLAGPAADAIGNKIPIAVTFALRTVLFVMLLQFKGVAPFWVFALGMGLTLPVTAALLPTLVGRLYGLSHIGFICGFVSTIHMLGGGLWAYLGGVIFDHTGDYDQALLISAVLATIALVGTLLIRDEHHVPSPPTP
jgi:MFS family permease